MKCAACERGVLFPSLGLCIDDYFVVRDAVRARVGDRWREVILGLSPEGRVTLAATARAAKR